MQTGIAEAIPVANLLVKSWESLQTGAAHDAMELERLNVRRLPALRSLDHVELHSLTLLEALETVRIDRRVVNKHILAVLTADEAKPLGIVEPLDSSLFHFRYYLKAFLNLPLATDQGFDTQYRVAENQSVSNVVPTVAH